MATTRLQRNKHIEKLKAGYLFPEVRLDPSKPLARAYAKSIVVTSMQDTQFNQYHCTWRCSPQLPGGHRL